MPQQCLDSPIVLVTYMFVHFLNSATSSRKEVGPSLARYVGCWGPNSGLHAWVANAVATGSSSPAPG